MEVRNSKDGIFEGKVGLSCLIEAADELTEAEQGAFLLLGDAYKRGKYVGYAQGRREAAEAAGGEV